MPPQVLCDPSTGAPYRLQRVLCEDGKRRSAEVTGRVSSYYRIPAVVRVTVAGKRVSVGGWVTDEEGDFLFFAHPGAKHAHLLKGKE